MSVASLEADQGNRAIPLTFWGLHMYCKKVKNCDIFVGYHAFRSPYMKSDPSTLVSLLREQALLSEQGGIFMIFSKPSRI